MFFGRKYVEGSTSKLANFEQMRASEYVVEIPEKDNIKCEAESFVGGDPLPGVVKDCYCDDKGIIPEEEVEDQIYYWEDVLAE